MYLVFNKVYSSLYAFQILNPWTMIRQCVSATVEVLLA